MSTWLAGSAFLMQGVTDVLQLSQSTPLEAELVQFCVVWARMACVVKGRVDDDAGDKHPLRQGACVAQALVW